MSNEEKQELIKQAYNLGYEIDIVMDRLVTHGTLTRDAVTSEAQFDSFSNPINWELIDCDNHNATVSYDLIKPDGLFSKTNLTEDELFDALSMLI